MNAYGSTRRHSDVVNSFVRLAQERRSPPRRRLLWRRKPIARATMKSASLATRKATT